MDPPSCATPDILKFLQDMLETGKSLSTLKGMVAAIKAAWVGPWKLAEACCDLITQFLKGAQAYSPLQKTSYPPMGFGVGAVSLAA